MRLTPWLLAALLIPIALPSAQATLGCEDDVRAGRTDRGWAVQVTHRCLGTVSGTLVVVGHDSGERLGDRCVGVVRCTTMVVGLARERCILAGWDTNSLLDDSPAERRAVCADRH